MTHAHNQVLIL